jgi:hypothetical protein
LDVATFAYVAKRRQAQCCPPVGIHALLVSFVSIDMPVLHNAWNSEGAHSLAGFKDVSIQLERAGRVRFVEVMCNHSPEWLATTLTYLTTLTNYADAPGIPRIPLCASHFSLVFAVWQEGATELPRAVRLTH